MALEQNSPEYLMSLALKVNSVNRLLEQHEMHHDRNTVSNVLTLPAPPGSITPMATAKAFCPTEKTPPVSPGAQSTQVSHMQALNLQESQATAESIVRRLTPVKMVDQPMDQSGSSTAQIQAQPVTPVSFVSTTQVRMDTVVTPTVNQVPPQVPPVQVPPFTNHKSQV